MLLLAFHQAFLFLEAYSRPAKEFAMVLGDDSKSGSPPETRAPLSADNLPAIIKRQGERLEQIKAERDAARAELKLARLRVADLEARAATEPATTTAPAPQESVVRCKFCELPALPGCDVCIVNLVRAAASVHGGELSYRQALQALIAVGCYVSLSPAFDEALAPQPPVEATTSAVPAQQAPQFVGNPRPRRPRGTYKGGRKRLFEPFRQLLKAKGFEPFRPDVTKTFGQYGWGTPGAMQQALWNQARRDNSWLVSPSSGVYQFVEEFLPDELKPLFTGESSEVV